MPYGLSFQPGSEQNGQGGREDREAGRATPIQTAIKLLSLRLPTTVSPSALAPQALLQGQGGAGFGGMNLEELLRRLVMGSGGGIPPEAQGVFRSSAASAGESGGRASASSVPTPRIGIGQTEDGGTGGLLGATSPVRGTVDSRDFVPPAARSLYESGGAKLPSFNVGQETVPIESDFGGPLSPFERALGRRFT